MITIFVNIDRLSCRNIRKLLLLLINQSINKCNQSRMLKIMVPSNIFIIHLIV